ncbi:hypothetical protein Tco_0466636 [Tanacetum coccineum]
MMEREQGECYSFTKKKYFVCGSLSHLIKDCDYYEKKMARDAEVKKQRVVNTGNGVAKTVWTNANRVNHSNKFVPRSVQLNVVRPNTNSVRPYINTGRTNINSVRPRVNAISSYVNTVRSRHPVPIKTSNKSMDDDEFGDFEVRLLIGDKVCISSLGIQFRLGEEQRSLLLVEFGWRVGLYYENEGGEIDMGISLQNALTVREEHRLLEFWRPLGMGFTQRITLTNLFFLYRIHKEGAVCNIPFWLARYLSGVRDGGVVCGGIYVTWLAQSFGILTRSMMGALNVEPPA